MKRFLSFFSVGLASGLALAVLLLAAARQARPLTMDVSDSVSAMSVALTDVIAREVQSGTKELYVQSTLSYRLVPMLQQLHPSIHFLEGKDRPPDHGCENSDPDLMIMGACKRNDFISAAITARPLWRTLLVQVGYHNGGCDLVLVKVRSKWRAVSNQCFYI